MQGDMSQTQEKAVLTLMAKITSITDLSILLNVVVQELPSVVGAIGCGIYLRPDYVPEYNGLLKRADEEVNEENLDDFIVLAATNLESKKALIGKAFFSAGEGITGWVYKNSKLLRINDVTNDKELKSLYPDLVWANENHDGDELYQHGDRRPLLAAPLILEDNPIGTLKFHATHDKQPFSEISQEIVVIVSQIISGVLRQTWLVAEQSQTISRLIETSNKNAPLDVIKDVTYSMKEMLKCSRSEFFLRSEDGKVVQLIVRNEREIPKSIGVEFERGQNLVGWIFKTGLPLIVPNIRQFIKGVDLDDDLLEKYSNSQEINDEDRYIRYIEDEAYYLETNKLQTISFVGVPIKSKDQEVQGVLCGYRSISAKSRYPFDRSQLILATSFATTIALTLENERQKTIGELLTELGDLTQTDQLFKTVTEKIPKFVASSGCSIFSSVLRHGVLYLKLTRTSHKGLILEDGTIPKIEYDLGEAKTGMCGLFQSTLVANHYGKGKVSLIRLDRELERIKSEHPNDVTDMLFDSSNNKVGIFQVRSDEKLQITKRINIHDFAKTVVFQSKGLSSQKLDGYVGSQWSFVAIPISSDDKLLGVVTLDRPTPESPFLANDISLLKSIAGRLASVMNNLRILEHREQLVMSLAHEINTPLTGLLADSENLHEEAPANSDLQKIARHNLGQVQRLHMQASAIMSVLSEKKPARQFTEHSVFRPLKEACELFETEAAQNGCDILGPKARDGNFPTIEMSLFDLAIAFKNIVHNAVKYSFRPPINMDIHRTIKVWGQWDKDQKGYYTIFVQNYGVGINPIEIEKRLIFQPYYRGEKASDRRRSGSGFGLAHARLVIEDLHHGFINTTSIHQGGDAYLTTFAISLPIKQPKPSNNI